MAYSAIGGARKQGLAPIASADCTHLILGTFPGEKNH